MEYLIIIGISLLISGAFLLAFRYGLSLGQTVSKGELKPLKTPIKALKDAKETKIAKEEGDKLTDEFDFILGYSKEKAYEEQKKANTL